jgi:hypothetical protein
LVHTNVGIKILGSDASDLGIIVDIHCESAEATFGEILFNAVHQLLLGQQNGCVSRD